MRNNSAVSLEMQMVYSKFVKTEDWNRRADETKKPSTSQVEYIGEWQTADGQWTDLKFEWTNSNPVIVF